MDATKSVTFTDLEWLPPDGEVERCRLTYRMADGGTVQHGTVTVVVSRTLVRLWQLDADEIAAELLLQAREHLADRLFHGTLRLDEDVHLTSPTTVRLCPYDPQGMGVPLNVPLPLAEGCRVALRVAEDVGSANRRWAEEDAKGVPRLG